LTVSNFNNVTGLQYIITYPAANLEFVSFTSPALGPPLQLNEFNDGNLRAIYVDSDQSGETLMDGTVLMTICFTNETAGATNVEFASVQVGDTNGVDLIVRLVPLRPLVQTVSGTVTKQGSTAAARTVHPVWPKYVALAPATSTSAWEMPVTSRLMAIFAWT